MNYNINNINEQIVLLRKQELTQSEIAEKLNITRDKVRYALKKAGLKGFKYKRVCKNCGVTYESLINTSKFCKDKCKSEYNRNRKGSIQICIWCNKEFRSYKIREHCNSKCREEDREETNTRKELIVRLIKSIDPNRQKECKGCGKVFYAHYIGRHYCSEGCRYLGNYVPTIHKHICRECGKHYADSITNSAGCSDECKRRYKSRKDEVSRRTMLRENGKIDWDISVDRLVNRDKSTCYICNEKVNKNDYMIDHNGHFIAGNNYPSIDHVIPVAKGGTHTWDNVKLAHRICNSLKSDIILD